MYTAYVERGWWGAPWQWPDGQSHFGPINLWGHIFYRMVKDTDECQCWTENFVWTSKEVAHYAKTVSQVTDGDAPVA